MISYWQETSKWFNPCEMVVFPFFRKWPLRVPLKCPFKIVSHSATTYWARWLSTLWGRGTGQGPSHHLLTLKWCRWRLSHVYMLFIDQVNGLVLGNLHTCANITFPMKKECESTGQMLTKKETMRNSTTFW